VGAAWPLDSEKRSEYQTSKHTCCGERNPNCNLGFGSPKRRSKGDCEKEAKFLMKCIWKLSLSSSWIGDFSEQLLETGNPTSSLHHLRVKPLVPAGQPPRYLSPRPGTLSPPDLDALFTSQPVWCREGKQMTGGRGEAEGEGREVPLQRHNRRF
jgi:hypothetical protein